MGILDKVVEHLVETNFDVLPVEAVDATKKQILDMLGVIIAGSTCSLSGEINGLVEMIREWGGKAESTIIAFGGKVPAHNAAFVNGVLCVRRDFDDTNLHDGGLHTSRAIVPVAFAMAERQGNITGKELLTAAALGHDLEGRIAAAGGGMSIFYMSTNFFGSAATAGKILRLDRKRMRSALNLTYHQICGASGGGGSAGLGNLKGLSNGICSKAAIMSAQLALMGFTADWDFLDEENISNFYQTFYRGIYKQEKLTGGLGKKFFGTTTSQKEFPCCHGQHSSIQATLDLVRENNIKPDDVEKVTIRISDGDFNLLANPVDEKQNPKNIIEAQFSLCWGVAGAIVYREVGIDNFTEKALQDKRVTETARKVFGRSKKDLAMKGQGTAPAIVEIKMKDGSVYSKKSGYLFGSPEKPMTLADVADKFRYCCEYSVNPIPREKQDRVIEMIEGLEQVKDTGSIIRLLV